jgi:hypothetical protein
VEVSPAYDNKGETTALAAAQVAFEIITSLVKSGVRVVQPPGSGVPVPGAVDGSKTSISTER